MIRALQWVVRLVVGGLFVYAGVRKLLDTQGFATDILHYRILPPDAVLLLAIYLPWLEILAGAALVGGILYRGGLAILSALTVIFIGAIASAMARGLDISCGCFGAGASGTANPWWMLARDVGILCATIFLALAGRHPIALGKHAPFWQLKTK